MFSSHALAVSTKLKKIPCIMLTLALSYLLCSTFDSTAFFTEACSSRTVPKPRPSTTSSSIAASSKSSPTTTTTTTSSTTTTTTPRPNITFPTYKCPATYDAWYCLNDATCFSVKIGDSIMYNCECASGFMGPRCEYKELDGSYLPKRPRPMLEKASIASGATLALLFMLFVCLTLYLRYDQKTSKYMGTSTADDDFGGGYTRCLYCNEKCCNDEVAFAFQAAENWRRRTAVSGGVNEGGFTKQHLEAMPMTFAIKRTMKM